MSDQTPITSMPEADVRAIADLTSVPFEKVRGIVWLAERHLREKEGPRTPMFPLGPIGSIESFDPCSGCGPICDSVACPLRSFSESNGSSG